MDRAKHCVDRFGIGESFIHRKQAGLKFGELLFAFLEEGLLYGRHRVQALGSPRKVQAATRRIASTSLTESKGLTIQPVAPAWRARFFFSPSLSVVSTRIGIARNRASLRTASMKPNPSSLGMLRSVTITCGVSSPRSISRPCKPSTACV